MLRRKPWLLLLAAFGCSSPALAFGDRAHALIATVAVQVYQQALPADKPLRRILGDKAAVLAHLANVPDTVWRQGDPATVSTNAPTHYFAIEVLGDSPSLATLPRTIAALKLRLDTFCTTHPAEERCIPSARATERPEAAIGTSPWRVAQLYAAMVEDVRGIVSVLSQRELNHRVDDLILHMGLIAHFVGELAQPLHNSVDFDAYGTGHGGVHGFFETEMVEAAGQKLADDVYTAALRKSPLLRLRRDVSQALADVSQVDTERLQTLVYAQALALDSWHQIPRLLQLDAQYALRAPSHERDGLRVPAQRVAAKQALGGFHDLLVERLSLAIAVTVDLWQTAWTTGGAPDLSRYSGTADWAAPGFVRPNY